MSTYPPHRSAYILFSLDSRAKNASKFDGMKQTDIAKQLGADWTAASDDVKAPFKAAEAKEKKAFDAYVAKHGPPPKKERKVKRTAAKSGRSESELRTLASGKGLQKEFDELVTRLSEVHVEVPGTVSEVDASAAKGKGVGKGKTVAKASPAPAKEVKASPSKGNAAPVTIEVKETVKETVKEVVKAPAKGKGKK